MIKDGKGGANTLTGLHFEERISLTTVFEKANGYSVKGNEIYYGEQKVAELYPKHKLYKELLEPNNIDYTDFISKKLLPDDAIFIMKNKTLFIVEIKFQETAGSVDEKLQTCDFKNKQYTKLLSRIGITVRYTYVLNDWFKKPEYKDVLDYIKASNCYYFFNEIPFSFFDLPTPK